MIHQRRRSDLKTEMSEAHNEWPTLARQKEKRTALLEKSARGIAIYDVNQNMIDCNGVYASMLDLSPSLVRTGVSLIDVLQHCVDQGDVPGNDAEHYIAKHLNTVRRGAVETIIENLPDGRVLSIGYIAIDAGGFIVTLDDVSDIQAIKDELEHAGFYDRRTSLPNERILLRCIDEAYMQSWEEEFFALLLVRNTNFDAIRAQVGNLLGHALAKKISNRIRESIRQEDLPSKLEGPEFAILMRSVSEASNAQALATRLIERLSMPYNLDGTTVLADFAIGIAMPNVDDDREAVLLANGRAAADSAAKQSGLHTAFYIQQDVALSA